jgi:hypothetical protein
MAVVFGRRSNPSPVTVAGSGENAKQISEEKFVNIHDRPGEVNMYSNMYTWEITKVRGEYIEYDVNAFTGCYGESIFLLDEDQPEGSVKPCDHGRAVVMYARPHPAVTMLQRLAVDIERASGLG